MNVFIAVPYNAQSNSIERIASLLRQYGHECNSMTNGWINKSSDPDRCDAVVLGIGWHECPVCRNIRYDAVCAGKIIAYESDLCLLDLHTLRTPETSVRREYRIQENTDGIHVQVKGRYFGLWHTVKTFRDDADPAYARLLANELIDKLTDN